MNVLIENYRGYDIMFDTERERFSFESDANKWGEKQSFAAAKKGVDDKPFKIVRNEDYSRQGIVILEVVGIRKDNRFTVKKPDGKIEQLSEYDERNYDVFDPKNESKYSEINEHELGTELILNERKRVGEQLRSKISAKNLREYKKSIIQP